MSAIASMIGDFPFFLPTETIHAVAATTYGVFGPALDQYEALLTAAAPQAVEGVRTFVDDRMHPLARGMPMMDPVTVSFLIVAYFAFLAAFYVVGRVTGKLELRAFGILYNFVCVVLSLYMSVGLGWEGVKCLGGLWNNAVTVETVEGNHSEESMRNILFVFFASKLLEYTDTFIMVLKHNYRQVSFLHVYHHTSIVVVVYVYFVLAPGGDSYWSAMVNSGVHVVMYAYYLLNLIFRTGPVKSFLQANKLIITVGQLTQFVLNVVQTLFVLFIAPASGYPRFIMWLQMAYMGTMIALFGNFLIKNNGAKKGGKSSSKKQKSE